MLCDDCLLAIGSPHHIGRIDANTKNTHASQHNHLDTLGVSEAIRADLITFNLSQKGTRIAPVVGWTESAGFNKRRAPHANGKMITNHGHINDNINQNINRFSKKSNTLNKKTAPNQGLLYSKFGD